MGASSLKELKKRKCCRNLDIIKKGTDSITFHNVWGSPTALMALYYNFKFTETLAFPALGEL